MMTLPASEETAGAVSLVVVPPSSAQSGGEMNCEEAAAVAAVAAQQAAVAAAAAQQAAQAAAAAAAAAKQIQMNQSMSACSSVSTAITSVKIGQELVIAKKLPSQATTTIQKRAPVSTFSRMIGTMLPDNTDEKSVAITVTSMGTATSAATFGTALAALNENAVVQDCDAALDALDSCVACAEGVDLQNQYEDSQVDSTAILKGSGLEGVTLGTKEHQGGLTESEAALVRLQLMEEEQKKRTLSAVSTPAGATSAQRGMAAGETASAASGVASSPNVTPNDYRNPFVSVMGGMDLCSSDVLDETAEFFMVAGIDPRAKAASAAVDADTALLTVKDSEFGTTEPGESTFEVESIAGASSTGGPPSEPELVPIDISQRPPTRAATSTPTPTVPVESRKAVKPTPERPILPPVREVAVDESRNDAAFDNRNNAPASRGSASEQCIICLDEEGSAESPEVPSSEASTDLKAVTFAQFPCCGKSLSPQGSDNNTAKNVCISCIIILSTPTSDGLARVGRCPFCRSWVTISKVSGSSPDIPAGMSDTDEKADTSNSLSPSSKRTTRWVITKAHGPGQCTICNQEKDHLVDKQLKKKQSNDAVTSSSTISNAAEETDAEQGANQKEQDEGKTANTDTDSTESEDLDTGDNNVCDACYLGRRSPLLYECQTCRRTQRIPHPMYRYQPSREEFGRTSWACHQTCKKFKLWRILPSQVKFIPVGDFPAKWGEDFLSIAKARVAKARCGTAPGVANNDVAPFSTIIIDDNDDDDSTVLIELEPKENESLWSDNTGNCTIS